MVVGSNPATLNALNNKPSIVIDVHSSIKMLNMYKNCWTNNLETEIKQHVSLAIESLIYFTGYHKISTLLKLKSLVSRLSSTIEFLTYKLKNLRSDILSNLITLHYVKQERLYTKLKYSRSPAYDSVSGGIAILLAGLLGFLSSEKFGFELVDSADFYFVWMYFVFIAIFLRPLLVTVEKGFNVNYILSTKRFMNYFNTGIDNISSKLVSFSLRFKPYACF